MASPRLFVPGVSHHVYHRGNNGTDVFVDDADRLIFLMILGRVCRRASVRIHNYTLMTTHYHTMVTAPDELALPRTMQRLGRQYVRYFNRRHGRSGTLWEGRYQASLITTEQYWLTCMRYVETNPVAARMVPAPEAYAWSSYRHHALGEDDPLITQHALYQALGATPAQRQAEWRRLCAAPLPPEQIAILREALRIDGGVDEVKRSEHHRFSRRPVVVCPDK
jgi:putative transposase